MANALDFKYFQPFYTTPIFKQSALLVAKTLEQPILVTLSGSPLLNENGSNPNLFDFIMGEVEYADRVNATKPVPNPSNSICYELMLINTEPTFTVDTTVFIINSVNYYCYKVVKKINSTDKFISNSMFFLPV